MHLRGRSQTGAASCRAWHAAPVVTHECGSFVGTAATPQATSAASGASAACTTRAGASARSSARSGESCSRTLCTLLIRPVVSSLSCSAFDITGTRRCRPAFGCHKFLLSHDPQLLCFLHEHGAATSHALSPDLMHDCTRRYMNYNGDHLSVHPDPAWIFEAALLTVWHGRLRTL